MRACFISYDRFAQLGSMIFRVMGVMLAIGSSLFAQGVHNIGTSQTGACAHDSGGITLPPGFARPFSR